MKFRICMHRVSMYSNQSSRIWNAVNLLKLYFKLSLDNHLLKGVWRFSEKY